MSVSRRSFLELGSLAIAPAFWMPVQAPRAPAAIFPTQPPDLAREMVGVSHSNLVRVKELLAISPNLARASWDWGFGDWEDALGAASHVGNREIAETLITHGARPTIFSAAMLGQLDAVKGFIAAVPGIEATPGPHSINLLRHAVAGGDRAHAVVEYLKTLPAAGKSPETQPLTDADLTVLVGEYVYGSAPDERIAIAAANGLLTFTRVGRNTIRLNHAGERAFFTPGAPHVRIRFRETPAAMVLSVHDPDLVLEARRSR